VEKTTEKEKKEHSVWLSAPMIIGYVLTTLIVVFWSIVFICAPKSKFVDFWSLNPNEIGDTFAGLFGSLAFVWIVVTVMLQGQELRAQREVLTAQKEELEAQYKEFKLTNKNMSYQIFESTFSSLITTYNNIVSSIDLVNIRTNNIIKGRDCFKIFYSRLIKTFKKYNNHSHTLEHIYELFWKNNQHELGHYFRFLYRAFLILETNPHAQPYHSKILRSLISDHELLLLFYNCLSPNGEKFLPLAVKFELFDNMPISRLLDNKHIELINPPTLLENYTTFNSESTHI